MPKKIIRLEYPAVCADCGTKLHAGAEARYYGRGKVYGVGCHTDTRPARASGGRASAPRVVSTRCEDYPCCGHGPVSAGGDGGPCPRVYEDGAGRQTTVMPCCGCGKDLPKNSPSSMCARCLASSYRDDDESLSSEGGY